MTHPKSTAHRVRLPRVEEINDAARGRWRELLSTHAGFNPDHLDGRGHPCPFCGEGDDRFNADRKTFETTGKCHCNICGFHGTGIDAVMQAGGVDLNEARRLLGETLNLVPAGAATVPSPRPPADRAEPAKRASPPKYATADEAAAALAAKMGGPPSVRYVYADENGDLLGEVLRWDRPDGGKDIRQTARGRTTWECRAMTAPRPLYRLPDVAEDPDETVFVVEGEKAADSLASVGVTATTSPGGSNAFRKADWTPLAGRDVTIWPDADEPGAKYAAGVAEALTALTPPATVRILDPAALWDGDGDPPPGWDAADFVEAADAVEPETLKARVLAAAEAAPPFVPRGDTRNPLDAGENGGFGNRPGGFVPFPLEALPEPVRGYVGATAGVIGCEPALVAGPLLAALASAIGNSRRLRLNNSYSEPAIVWCAGVCESGQRKSPALDAALAEAHRRQKTERKRWRDDHAEWERERARWEVEHARWKKKGEGDPPPEPPEPTLRSYLVDDTTIEALRDILDANPRGVLAATEELAGWFGMLDKYNAGKGGGDAAKWLSMHGGRPVRIDRRTGTPKFIYIPRASVSLCGTVQPGTLKRLLTAEHLESGLVARWLFVWPPARPLRWREGDVPTAVRDRLGAVVQALYDLKMVPDRDNDPEPVVVPLTAEAKRAYIEFFNENGAAMADARGEVAASFSKAAAYAARFALIVHLVREAAGDPTLEHPAGRDGDRDPGAVDAASVAAAVTMAEWFKRETTRVLAMLREDEGETARRELAEWIASHRGGSVTARDLAKARRHLYGGDSGEAEQALRGLSQHGYGRFEFRPPGPRGGRPTEDFVLHDPAGGDAPDAPVPLPETPVPQAARPVSGNARGNDDSAAAVVLVGGRGIDDEAIDDEATGDDGEGVGEWSA
ncbi:DUF3987 domain-containing protein [Alienimonas sp. DA493]|uniref:DUF3987 domain-containing protein n=1 Tax=Alienimonas sp. DA493 TaxID=3373605 RepID=UPI003754FEC9